MWDGRYVFIPLIKRHASADASHPHAGLHPETHTGIQGSRGSRIFDRLAHFMRSSARHS